LVSLSISTVSATSITTVVDTTNSIVIFTSDDGTEISAKDTTRNRYWNKDGIGWEATLNPQQDSINVKIIPGSKYFFEIYTCDSTDTTLLDTVTVLLPTSDNPIYHYIDSLYVKNNIHVGKSIYNYDTTKTSNIGTCEEPFDTVFVKTLALKSGDSCIYLDNINNNIPGALFSLYFDGSPIGRSYKLIFPSDVSFTITKIVWSLRYPVSCSSLVDTVYIINNNTGDTSFFQIPYNTRYGISYIDHIEQRGDDEIEIKVTGQSSDCCGYDLNIIAVGITYGFIYTGTSTFLVYSTPYGELVSPDLGGLDSVKIDSTGGPIIPTSDWIVSYIDSTGRWPTYYNLYEYINEVYNPNDSINFIAWIYDRNLTFMEQSPGNKCGQEFCPRLRIDISAPLFYFTQFWRPNVEMVRPYEPVMIYVLSFSHEQFDTSKTIVLR